MKIQVYKKRYLNKLALLMFTAPVILMTAGCGEIDTGEVQNSVQLPVDSVLNFRCEDEGIFPEDCVLDNPENPYVSVAVTEDNKFDLAEDAPSAKSRYYLWATALARGAGLQGENQYYTAVSLHEVYGESGSPTTRDQARKAYRSVLDNFFLAPSFFTLSRYCPISSCWRMAVLLNPTQQAVMSSVTPVGHVKTRVIQPLLTAPILHRFHITRKITSRSSSLAITA